MDYIQINAPHLPPALAPGNFYNFDAIFLMMRGRVVLFLLRYPVDL